MDKYNFSYRLAKKEDDSLIREWLKQDYLAQWIHGDGLKNTLSGLSKQYEGNSDASYWLVSLNEEKFSFLITCPIDKQDKHFTQISFGTGEAISLDVFICVPYFLNKGIGTLMIKNFLMKCFKNLTDITIDPEATNKRAIHVYKKLGFKFVNEFIADWHPVPHYLMHLRS